MSKIVEEWRPVVGYEGEYEVSDWGRVRGLDRYVNTKGNSKRLVKGKILKQWFRDRYLCVSLRHNDFHNVHRLVAEAWIPNPEDKPYIDHINGIRDCNFVWNLRWVTQKENLNAPLARFNISQSSKIKVLRRNRNNLGQFVS